ncbi:DUF2809 domain-containing protein [Citricoccus sp. GCM10030269]|uniref:ribosomal maturation YjgA family protein n=1 Tax=Citricoccus sp. GCM10030269 TaxID=3273388 RepID=UPI00360E92D6
MSELDATGSPSARGAKSVRLAIGVVALTTVALGLGVRWFGDGAWTGPVGDALYAVLIYLLVSLAIPRRSPMLVAGIAVVICALVELFQLSGLPLQWAETWPPIRLVLGTTFGWSDLLAYVLGCVVAGVVAGVVSSVAVGAARRATVGVAVGSARRTTDRRVDAGLKRTADSG